MVNTSIIELQPKVDQLIAVDAKSDKLDKLKDDLSQVQALTENVLTKVGCVFSQGPIVVCAFVFSFKLFLHVRM